MKRIAITTLSALLGLMLLLVLATNMQAAPPTRPGFNQSCNTDNTANIDLFWTSEPSAREVWIDASTVNANFEMNTYASEGPLSARDNYHLWRNLEAHKV